MTTSTPPGTAATGWVRRARVEDAAAIGEIQLAAWRGGYADLLPASSLAELSAEDLASRWQESIAHPPSARHQVLVAVDTSPETARSGAPETGVSGGRVVGFAAFGPTADQDCDGAVTAEVFALTVAPAATGRGHGSRLLAACADLLREAGFRLAVCWALLGDDPFRSFLQGAGWGPDGAYRDLERGDDQPPTRSVRLVTSLEP